MTLRGALKAFIDDASPKGNFAPARAAAKVTLERRLERISRTSTLVLITIMALEALVIVFGIFVVFVASDRANVLSAIGKVSFFNVPVAIGTIASFANRKASVDTVLAILPQLSPEQAITVVLALLSSGKAAPAKAAAG